MQSKITHKVLLLKERNDGSTWWFTLGGGHRSREKDDSFTLYLDAGPTTLKDGSIKLHVCPLTEQELREREERRAAYRARGGGAQSRGPYDQGSARGTLDYNGLPASGTTVAADGVPF